MESYIGLHDRAGRRRTDVPLGAVARRPSRPVVSDVVASKHRETSAAPQPPGTNCFRMSGSYQLVVGWLLVNAFAFHMTLPHRLCLVAVKALISAFHRWLIIYLRIVSIAHPHAKPCRQRYCYSSSDYLSVLCPSHSGIVSIRLNVSSK